MSFSSAFKSISTCISLLIVVVLWFIAQSSDYFPKVIAPFTQLHAVLLGMIATLVVYKHKNTRIERTVHFVWGISLICLGVYTSYNLIECKIYPWSLTWIISAVSVLKSKNRTKSNLNVEKEIQFQDYKQTVLKNPITADIMEDIQDPNQTRISNSQSSKKWFGNRCNNIMFLVNLLLICMFALNAHQIAHYTLAYPILGHTVTFRVPGQHYKVTFHYYCSDLANSKYPTIVLEHGGGGSLVGFVPLLKDLQKKGVKLCIYDRLGYGRSSKIIPNFNLRAKSEIVDFMLNLILRTDEKVIYGGWSAGVELSIAYSYYFPQRLQGLIFLDGYPDYLLLEAIQANSSTVRNPHTLFIANFFRFIQPFGFDMLFGSNEIANQTINSYYQAYYRTGYLWDTQSTDLRYMNTTSELSELGRQSGAKIPYPNSPIYLNWPDIDLPLLVMPANETIKSSQYKIQSQKYIQKCLNPVKRLSPIQGGHGFVLTSSSQVSKVIFEFINQIQ